MYVTGVAVGQFIIIYRPGFGLDMVCEWQFVTPGLDDLASGPTGALGGPLCVRFSPGLWGLGFLYLLSQCRPGRKVGVMLIATLKTCRQPL